MLVDTSEQGCQPTMARSFHFETKPKLKQLNVMLNFQEPNSRRCSAKLHQTHNPIHQEFKGITNETTNFVE